MASVTFKKFSLKIPTLSNCLKTQSSLATVDGTIEIVAHTTSHKRRIFGILSLIYSSLSLFSMDIVIMQGEWKCLKKSVRNINKIPCPHVFYSEIIINSISFNFRYTYSLKSFDFSPYEITPTSVYEMDLVVFPRVDQLLTCKQASPLMHEFSASWQFFKTNMI